MAPRVPAKESRRWRVIVILLPGAVNDSRQLTVAENADAVKANFAPQS
jgi:hypothetical protein